MILEERTKDKSNWGDGEWQDEPDRVEWFLDDNVLSPCLVRRNHLGVLCGYVGVPIDHPLHGENGEEYFSVHGGITYSGCGNSSIRHKLYRINLDGYWWFGFDCGHAYDLVPTYSSIVGSIGTYRNLSYVVREVEELAGACRSRAVNIARK